MTKQIHLTRRSPYYWRVTINRPPLNIFGPDTIPQLNDAITAIETDEQVKVVVFDSAIARPRPIRRGRRAIGPPPGTIPAPTSKTIQLKGDKYVRRNRI